MPVATAYGGLSRSHSKITVKYKNNYLKWGAFFRKKIIFCVKHNKLGSLFVPLQGGHIFFVP